MEPIVWLLVFTWTMAALAVMTLVWAEGARRFERDPDWEADQ